MNSLYLWINIGTIVFPLLLSFDKKVAFYKKWPTLLPAIFITGVFFLIWDQWFSVMNIWGFNAIYLTGYYLGELPIEEVMFFMTVPYACVFIYECLRAYIKHSETFEELYRWFTLLFFAFMVSILPMLIVNGILTYKPVVYYNDAENMGLRLGSIPVEDFLYNMTMFVMCIGLYEWFNRLRLRRQLHLLKQSS